MDASIEDGLLPDSLRYFGAMAASISHEIANTLAIINENAGLLSDIALASGKGMPVDPQRVAAVAAKIQGQVLRTDGIVKRMNTFAHRVDEPCASVDLGETVDLVVALSSRIAAMRSVTLEHEKAGPIPLTTSPFLLCSLVYKCLDRAMTAVGKGGKVVLAAKTGDGVVHLVLTGTPEQAHLIGSPFGSDAEKALLGALGASVDSGARTCEILVSVPRDARCAVQRS